MHSTRQSISMTAVVAAFCLFACVTAAAAPSIKVTTPRDSSTVTQRKIVLKGTASDEKGLTDIIINGKGFTIERAKSMDFERSVTLEQGRNVILVTAINTEGEAADVEVSVVYDPNANSQPSGQADAPQKRIPEEKLGRLPESELVTGYPADSSDITKTQPAGGMPYIEQPLAPLPLPATTQTAQPDTPAEPSPALVKEYPAPATASAESTPPKLANTKETETAATQTVKNEDKKADAKPETKPPAPVKPEKPAVEKPAQTASKETKEQPAKETPQTAKAATQPVAAATQSVSVPVATTAATQTVSVPAATAAASIPATAPVAATKAEPAPAATGTVPAAATQTASAPAATATASAPATSSIPAPATATASSPAAATATASAPATSSIPAPATATASSPATATATVTAPAKTTAAKEPAAPKQQKQTEVSKPAEKPKATAEKPASSPPSKLSKDLPAKKEQPKAERKAAAAENKPAQQPQPAAEKKTVTESRPAPPATDKKPPKPEKQPEKKETPKAPATSPPPRVDQKPPARRLYTGECSVLAAQSFLFKENADAAMKDLTKKGFSASVYEEKIGKNTVYHIVLGIYRNESDAKAASGDLAQAGYKPEVLKTWCENMDFNPPAPQAGQRRMDNASDSGEMEMK